MGFHDCGGTAARDDSARGLAVRLGPLARRYVRANRLTESAPGYESPETILAAAEATVAAVPDAALAAEGAPVFALVLAAARALARGDAAGALALGRRAAPRLQNDLALQRLMARARSALPGAAPETAPEGFCRAPFENLETAPGGDVFFCCPAWLPKPIGNLGDASAGEIWNSPVAQDIRASIHDGSYRHCSRVHCPKLSGGRLDKPEALPPRLRAVAGARQVTLPEGPRKVILSHDRSCNLACPSCRTGLILARKEEQAALNALADRVILPLLAGADRVRVTASGDPFGSAHFQYVLRNLGRVENPRLRLDLQTNGLLLTPRLWEALGLEGRVDQLIVSADAARAETYAEVRGGRFETLLDNLGFFARLRREGRIASLRLDFVVQAANHAEMPEFVQLARTFGCDGVKFQMIRSWGTWSAEEFRRHDISDPAHPEHGAFLRGLSGLVGAQPFVEFWGMAAALRAASALSEREGHGGQGRA